MYRQQNRCDRTFNAFSQTVRWHYGDAASSTNNSLLSNQLNVCVVWGFWRDGCEMRVIVTNRTHITHHQANRESTANVATKQELTMNTSTRHRTTVHTDGTLFHCFHASGLLRVVLYSRCSVFHSSASRADGRQFRMTCQPLRHIFYYTWISARSLFVCIVTASSSHVRMRQTKANFKTVTCKMHLNFTRFKHISSDCTAGAMTTMNNNNQCVHWPHIIIPRRLLSDVENPSSTSCFLLHMHFNSILHLNVVLTRFAIVYVCSIEQMFRQFHRMRYFHYDEFSIISFFR